jgi:hypothetical protein
MIGWWLPVLAFIVSRVESLDRAHASTSSCFDKLSMTGMVIWDCHPELLSGVSQTDVEG